MGWLIIKNLKMPSIFSLILMPALAFLWFRRGAPELFPVAVFVQVIFSFVITILSVLSTEMQEEATRGYSFLETLPLRKREMLGAKFLVSFITVAVLSVANILIFGLFEVEREYLEMGVAAAILFGFISLQLAALTFMGTYSLGYSRFIRTTSVGLAVVVFVSFLATRLIRIDILDVGKIIDRFTALLVGLNLLLVAATGTALYLFLLFISTRIERKA